MKEVHESKGKARAPLHPPSPWSTRTVTTSIKRKLRLLCSAGFTIPVRFVKGTYQYFESQEFLNEKYEIW